MIARLPKLKSGALQMAIYVGVIVALLLSALMLYAYTFLSITKQSQMGANNIILADSGIAYLLTHKEIEGDTVNLDFHKTENQQLKVCASTWGVFRKAFAVARFRGKTFYKCALTGTEIIPETSPTLYLQDLDKPLSIVGNTLLKGNICLPRSGIRPGYIMGESYKNAKLVYGNTTQSTEKLPEFDPEIQKTLEEPPLTEENYKFDKIPNTIKRYTRLFSESTARMSASGAIDLQNVTLTGNIIIESDSLVHIASSCHLTDLVIRAPRIVIDDGTQGKFQAIASLSLTIGEDVKLDYPSALVLWRLEKTTNKTDILSIGKGSKISGIVLCNIPSDPNNYDTQLYIAENTELQGFTFCRGNLELRGGISGSVSTAQFVYKAGGTVFLNHIKDGSIRNTDLPDRFAGAVMKKGKQCVAQWLN